MDFNGTSVAPGSTLWFTAVFKLNGSTPSTNFSLRLTGQKITSPAFTVNVPDAVVNFSSSATLASTTFNTGLNTWVTTAPIHALSGNLFISAVQVPFPSGLAAGTKGVTWSGNWSTNATSAISVNWQWAVAAYTSFTTNYNAVGVKPSDDNHGDSFMSSDHAGTPENFKSFLVGGPDGGGGSNWTGSLSGTASVTPPQCTLTKANISLGYADNYFTHGTSDGLPWVNPTPISGLVIGCAVNPNGGGTAGNNCPQAFGTNSYDGGAILITNNSATDPLSVTGASVQIGSCNYNNVWPGLNITLPPGGNLVLTQTGGVPTVCPTSVVGNYNFDASESFFTLTGQHDGQANLNCTPDGAIPVVTLTLNGSTATITDSGQILNRHGVDPPDCNTNTDEFNPFVQVATFTG